MERYEHYRRKAALTGICLLVLLLTPTAPPPALARPPAAVAADSEPIEIDFDTVLTVPYEFRRPIEEAMVSGRSLLPAVDRFTVSALRSSGDWMHAILVPTYVVEAGWEVELKPDEIIEVLGQRNAANEISAYVRGSTGFTNLARETPKDFIDFNSFDVSPATVDYLFPWTSGQYWYKTQGWHEGDAMDFQPVVRTTPAIHYAVLAAASGRLTEICNDGYQSRLRIEHADGSTQYLHLDVNSVRRDLLGQNVARGQIVGLLYDGNQGARWHNGYYYQYWTACGYGTAVHLH